ncbi:polysaccharide deacetylase family protein [Natronosalvus vescus]|uniref:polysaccharide deacetylase family protein n=1 Tax=Natronosalvus vescus TaxID=2953881 RepID=UPI00209038C4|nr:polysaccharide deacetylase family protein [Natronosalvus vescus]
MSGLLDEYEFALCLTHDVDRPYKSFHAPYYAITERDLTHIWSAVRGEQPYWQFDELMRLEEDLGVRSSFYFLNEKRLLHDKKPFEWIKPINWVLYTGRYALSDERIINVIQKLERGGWEVGLHGSYDSYAEFDRLQYEKKTLEQLLEGKIIGGRQHYLNLNQPETWEYHRKIGLKYDSSMGSSSEYGFNGQYGVLRPFEDEFVVFPVTIMENALMNATESFDEAWEECEALLQEAQEQGAIMTVLWHLKFINNQEFPGYREIYERIVKTAQSMGAWVGSCRGCYEQLDLERDSTDIVQTWRDVP